MQCNAIVIFGCISTQLSKSTRQKKGQSRQIRPAATKFPVLTQPWAWHRRSTGAGEIGECSCSHHPTPKYWVSVSGVFTAPPVSSVCNLFTLGISFDEVMTPQRSVQYSTVQYSVHLFTLGISYDEVMTPWLGPDHSSNFPQPRPPPPRSPSLLLLLHADWKLNILNSAIFRKHRIKHWAKVKVMQKLFHVKRVVCWCYVGSVSVCVRMWWVCGAVCRYSR